MDEHIKDLAQLMGSYLYELESRGQSQYATAVKARAESSLREIQRLHAGLQEEVRSLRQNQSEE
jgi:molybdenum-dependent DNA-binding transcriptional regulator ModE